MVTTSKIIDFPVTVEEAFLCAKSHIDQQAYGPAYELFSQILLKARKGIFALTPGQKRDLGAQLWVYQPTWWLEQCHGNVSLRRCDSLDAKFVAECFQDTEFAKRYNRQTGWRGDLEKALDKYGKGVPARLGMLQWIVCYRSQPIGLASLSSIDPANHRAEFSIGIPGSPPAGVAHKASLLAMNFAYFSVGMHKLYTYVYADNLKAIHDTERLGFNPEGVLHDHYFLPPGEYVTVHVFGLTKPQAQQNTKLVKIVSRCINQNWVAGRLGSATQDY